MPFIVDSLDQIKEEHSTLYVEEDRKFRLDLDGYEDPKGLKTELQSERGAAKNVKQELQKLQKQFERIDPEIVKKWEVITCLYQMCVWSETARF